MSKRVIDIVGVVFGDLTVIKMIKKHPKRTHWECRCVCGNVSIVDGAKLKIGHTKSCGCLRKTFLKTHGESADYLHTKEYSAWAAMIKRCNNKNDPAYEDYGGRGIKVCERWLSYDNFLADAGRAPSKGHSIDRYPDNNGNYILSNFRWATASEQSRNHRRNVYLEHNGVKKVKKDWAIELGVGEDTISRYLKSGKTFEEFCVYAISDLFKMRQRKGKKIINETTATVGHANLY